MSHMHASILNETLVIKFTRWPKLPLGDSSLSTLFSPSHLATEMERLTDVPEGSYPLRIGACTELEIKVEHQGVDFGKRVVHLVSPETKVTGAFALPRGIRLRIVAPYLPYPDENGYAEGTETHCYLAIAQLLKGPEPDVLTPRHAWTLFYIFFTLWPGQKGFDFLVPNTIHNSQCMRESFYLKQRIWSYQYNDFEHDKKYKAGGVCGPEFWMWGGPGNHKAWIPDPELISTNRPPYESLICSTRANEPNQNHVEKEPGTIKSKYFGKIIYRRFIPETKCMLIYRCVHPDNDCEILKQCGRSSSPYCHTTIIGELNGVPFGCVDLIDYRNHHSFNGLTIEGQVAFQVYFDKLHQEKMRDILIALHSLLHMLFLLNPSSTSVVSTASVLDLSLIKWMCMSGGHISKVSEVG